jgi:hypothetical protein
LNSGRLLLDPPLEPTLLVEVVLKLRGVTGSQSRGGQVGGRNGIVLSLILMGLGLKQTTEWLEWLGVAQELCEVDSRSARVENRSTQRDETLL